MKGDLIECYKHFDDRVGINFRKFFEPTENRTICGHPFKIKKEQSRFEVRKHYLKENCERLK